MPLSKHESSASGYAVFEEWLHRTLTPFVRHRFLLLTLVLLVLGYFGVVKGELFWILLVVLGLAALPESREWYERIRLRRLGLAEVDYVSGEEFERWVAGQLEQRGYLCAVRDRQADYGCDIIATKNGVRVGIQAKRHHQAVGVSAIQQVIAGWNYEGCDAVAVVTQSSFSEKARDLAKKGRVRVILVDRHRLSRLGETLDRVVNRQKTQGDTNFVETPGTLQPKPATHAENGTGFCIGCRQELPRNRYKPFCLECFKKSEGGWQISRLANRVCHACGDEHDVTLARPLCSECYGRAAPPT